MALKAYSNFQQSALLSRAVMMAFAKLPTLRAKTAENWRAIEKCTYRLGTDDLGLRKW
jgi:ABC-type phosphate transport system permease subunit